MVSSSNLGFPRMGGNRELKKLVESFWSKKIDESALLNGAKNAGTQFIPSNDASLYDHVLDHLFVFGAIPQRYQSIPSKTDKYFAMGRGLQRPEEGIDVPAMEMKKWFDTNYHYIVGEFSPESKFFLQDTKPIDQYNEAKALGIQTRPVVLGPVSFLALGKPSSTTSQDFDQLTLLDSLLPVYIELLTKLRDAGAEWVQLDEPILSLDRPAAYKGYFEKAYTTITKAVPGLKVFLASYFGRYSSNLEFVADLPIQALHIDAVRAPADVEIVVNRVKNSNIIVSVGVVDGRNVWKNNLAKSIETVKKAVAVVGTDRVIVSPSCSLLHTPHSLESEVKLDVNIKSWMSFAVQKLNEISTIVAEINAPGSVSAALAENAACVESRRTSPLIHNPEVQAELKAVTPAMFKRQSVFEVRAVKQQKKLNLPLYPTTTVGSFPQTKEVRVARQKFKKGETTLAQYNEFINKEIEKTVRFQEQVGLDMLVHGEFERNDMVEYFGENLKGYVFSQYGWVQSYGSRCVKPPIIFGDVSRPLAMTVETSVYAQSLTKLPMKGMLTGPVTMLCWSFVRDDQPRSVTTNQIALALRKEVSDLAKAGIPAIQIDEPAIREGLPLLKEDQEAYLDWAVKAFLLATTDVPDECQIHTHMCYSDFNDIFEAIQALDADCITIENSKSDLKLLRAFEKYGYTNGIGPGLYDIHSPRVPPATEMKERLSAINKYIKTGLLWVNPDCGLKTRGWVETEAALRNMCAVAKDARASPVA
ncbi:methionine-synthesizing 5- methyltetrahydropteroyltriglutamate--homocysteine methyltransferase [Globomyces sp. JEL0801]|nr:methionine-synthesizing 5- methyltetrahydropteroyltriglutamate--homocysteine methyltransferase [Globomyces sp. JEL0801]